WQHCAAADGVPAALFQARGRLGAGNGGLQAHPPKARPSRASCSWRPGGKTQPL
ncbi:hypothetical protein GGH95_004973, partial [Coemansia sp. RSA 1836]